MKKIKSIYLIFVVFLVMVSIGFLFLYWYSRSSLRSLLTETARVQMAHSESLLEQKIKEIEIEADGILNSDGLRDLQETVNSRYGAYRFVTHVKAVRDYLENRQKSNVGMAEFILYWPKKGRLISTQIAAAVDKTIFASVEDSAWIVWGKDVFFARIYKTNWDNADEEPYLLIRMDRDYLYSLKNMASGMGSGGKNDP